MPAQTQTEPRRGLVDVKRMASMMNLTPRRVQVLVNDCGMPREEKGLYDAGKCLLWYIRYLQDALDKKAMPTGDGTYSGLTDERARSIRAGAELKEIELAEKRGTLVRVDVVKRVFIDLVHMTKARILATAPRIAPEVMGETSRVMVQALIEKQLKDALNHLADDGSNYSPVGDKQSSA